MSADEPLPQIEAGLAVTVPASGVPVQPDAEFTVPSIVIPYALLDPLMYQVPELPVAPQFTIRKFTVVVAGTFCKAVMPERSSAGLT